MKKQQTQKYDPQVVIDYYNEIGLTLLAEYKFTDEHGYRFDFFHPPSGVAIEVMGGVWLGSRGGHTSGAGYIRDMAKENLALSLGFRIMKCLPQDICMDDTRALFAKIVEVAKRGRAGNERSTDAKRGSVFSRRSDPTDGQESKARPGRTRSRVQSNRIKLSA